MTPPRFASLSACLILAAVATAAADPDPATLNQEHSRHTTPRPEFSLPSPVLPGSTYDAPGEQQRRKLRQFAPVVVTRSSIAKLEALIDPWQPHAFVKPESPVPGPATLFDFMDPSDTLKQFDAATVREVRRFDVDANPQAMAFTPSGEGLVVVCDPPGRRDRCLFLIDLKSGNVARRPIPGSSNLRGVAVDPRGRFALATHLIPKADLPATQIAQGWVFTNAISIVPLDEAQPIVTLPLDLRTQGFANPEGVVIASDGSRAYVSHAGADIVSVVDLPAMEATAARIVAATEPVRRSGQPAYRSEDLSLPKKYVRARIPVGANPRRISIAPDDSTVQVFNRLDQTLSVIDTARLEVTFTHTQRVSQPGAYAETELARLRPGAQLFYSGRISFSGQFSCASCHPDGHTDGLNWDLPADGFNNFHNTKSLLGAAGTAPYGWNGRSETLRSRFVGTLRTLFQYEPGDEEVAALEAYLEHLDYPSRLPRRTDPESSAAERGRVLFQGVSRCQDCHSGPRLADGGLHDVGTGSDDSMEFDTPSLTRVSETAPYLHDGRAETLEAIFRDHNAQGHHGNASVLDAAQLSDLIEYLKSL